jgi:hypothetical protein
MATYIQIGSTVTVGSGGAAYIEFTSIPSTYTDLLVKLSARSNLSNNYTSTWISFNGNTSNFSERELYAVGNATGSGNASDSPGAGQTSGYTGAGNNTANTFGNYEIYIPNYAGSTNKSFSTDSVVENNSSSGNIVVLNAGLWSNTSAITSVRFTPVESASFVQYSTASLYGIKKD